MYVHRRESASIAKLCEQEIQLRTRLGLISESETQDEDDSEASEERENFDEHDSLSDDDDASLSGRKSNVDPTHCIASPQGSMQRMTWTIVIGEIRYLL